jgi:hypothetical protein
MDFALTEGDLVEWLVEPELRSDRNIHLGDVLEIENIAAKCRGWIGDAPFSLDAERTARTLKASDEDWLRAARPEYSDRFVFTTFGVQSFGGLVDPAAIGLELVFRDNERKLNQSQRIHIHTLFPAARFQVAASSRGEFGAEFSGQLFAAAELSPPGQLIPASLDQATASLNAAEIKGSASQRIVLTNKRQLTWSTTTHAAIVEAIGEGDTRALWVFHRPHGPLTGKTFETVTGITISRKKTGINFDARMFVVFKIGPYPVRRYSPWIRLSTEWGE